MAMSMGPSHLFQPLKLRGLTVKNRVWMSPMCQYSAVDGLPNDWHLQHYVTRAVGGVGLILAEATGVVPEGRISPGCTGMWSDAHTAAWARIVAACKAQGRGVLVGIQLAHAGRKGSTAAPWVGEGAVGEGAVGEGEGGGWTPVAPSPLPFKAGYPLPRELSEGEVAALPAAFVAAAERSVSAGFDFLELHFAHGYLGHTFLSPLSNVRTDAYGGSFENRARMPLEVTRAVRRAMPAGMPLLVRISASDWEEGGWDVDQSIALCKLLREEGVDLVDVSSGGLSATAKVPLSPGYQVPFAHRVRTEAGVMTAAVGLITTPQQAEAVVAEGHADAVFLARELLRNPYFALHAADLLGDNSREEGGGGGAPRLARGDWPPQYLRSRPLPAAQLLPRV